MSNQIKGFFMEKELENLNNTLLEIYLNNLKFLEKSHPQVFQKIEKLSEDLENGIVTEKYSLEYKSEGGYFDIYDIQKGDFIYGFNSYEEADLRKEKINLTTEHSINLLRINPENKKITLNIGLSDIASLIDSFNEKINFEKIEFKKIFKFVFMGVGAGVHIHEVYKKIDSMNTLIIEPNLEIFRLSLFLVDYSLFEQGNKKLFLSIGENEMQRNNTYSIFSEYHSYMNYNIKYHLFSIDCKYILDELIDYYGHNYAGNFSHKSVLEVFKRTLCFFEKKYKFLQKDLIIEKKLLKDKKVLLISAGPSLDKEINWIKENQDKFIIICVDVIVKKLEKNEIIPDIVVSIDPSHLCANYLTTQNRDFLKNSAIVFLSQQHETVLEVVKDLNFYFSQVRLISQKIGYSFSLANVGTFSFAFSISLGANELYTIGNDAAFNQETGERYSKDSAFISVENISEDVNNQNNEEQIISYEDIIEVKGNLRDKIKSNRDLLGFRNDYETYLHDLNKSELKIYNLSDGAYIEGLTPLRSKDIDIDSFELVAFDAKKELDSISIDDIDDVEFKKDINILISIINKIKKSKKLEIKNLDDFFGKKLDITIWILEENKKMSMNFFGHLFLKYISLVDTYVNFVTNLNQKDLLTNQNLKYILDCWLDSTKIFFEDIRKIVSEYESSKSQKAD